MKDLKVLELGRGIAGAYCGKLMAGLGAEVVQALAPGVDPDWHGEAETVWFNTGKARITLSPERPLPELEGLIAGADVVLDAWGHGALERAGVTNARARELNPRLILCRITPFGLDGPYSGFEAEDITLYAMGGMMHSTGDGRREPLNARPKIAQLTAGLNAYLACTMALMRRERDGVGELIDLSIHESSMENIETHLAEQLALNKTAKRNKDTPPMVPWRTYACRDGEAAIIGGPIRNWRKVAPLFGQPKLMEPEFASMGERMQRREAFEALMRPWLSTQTRRQVMEAGQAAGLAWSYVASIKEALADPQHAARGYFVEFEQHELGRCKLPGAPFRGPDLHWTNQPAPVVPQPPQSAIAGWRDTNTYAPPKPSPGAPLAGICVLDFTHDWAGPHAARVLADYGADVIKIEYPKRLDGMRGGYKDRLDEHPRFWQLQRNKNSITLDLESTQHRMVLEELLTSADLVLENSRPGVMDRKGLGWDELRELNPAISLVSMSAFGATGPYSQYAGYGGTIEAISGLQSLTGYDSTGPGMRVREMDVINGIFGACAAMTALWQKKLTGKGQWIDLSETETCAWMIGEFLFEAARSGIAPARLGNRHARHAPQGCYAAAGADRWLVLSIRSDAEWQRLAAVIGPEAQDPRYSRVSARRALHDEIDAIIGSWARRHDARGLALRLQGEKLAAGWVATTADLVNDPHLAARGWFQNTPEGHRLPGFPFKLANGGAKLWRGKLPLGVDNEALFTAAGLNDLLPNLSPDKLGTAYDTE